MKNRDQKLEADEDMIRHLEKTIEEGTALDDYQPVRVKTPATSRRAVFSIKLSQDELMRITAAAELRGSSIGEFIRSAALETAALETGESGESLAEMKVHVDALSRSIRRQMKAG